MIKKVVLLSISLLIFDFSQAQIGGASVYKFLTLSNSTRQTALGGLLLSIQDDDPTLIMQNPSTISPRFSTSLALNFADYFTNSSLLSALYSHTFKKAGSFAVEMRYLGYGSFIQTDEAGNELGTFSANDLAFTIGWGRQLDSNFSIGAAFKIIYSGYEKYNSFGIAADVAGTYHNNKKNISLTLLFKNMGSQLKTFVPGQFEKIPFDIQLAFSQKFKFLPVRYHLSLHSLYRWNMAYNGVGNPFLEVDVANGGLKYPSKAAQFFDNMFRHLAVGLEIIPVKYLSIQIGYNHNQHQEMKTLRKSMAGFSYGFMINIHSIQFGFARSEYGIGVAPNYFMFALNINEIAKLNQTNKAKKLVKKTTNENGATIDE